MECVPNPDSDPCGIPIQHNEMGNIDHFNKVNAWRSGDTLLTWHGAQLGQGQYNFTPAEGTPSAWTTDDNTSDAYMEDNQWGPNMWKVDLMMDCSLTDDGWFALKGFTTQPDPNGGWENNINQNAVCLGTAGGQAPAGSLLGDNHKARCGYLNMFR